MRRDIIVCAFLAACLVLAVQNVSLLLAGNSSTPTRTANYTAGTVIDPAVVNADINQLYSELQGNVGTANLLDNSVTTAKIVAGNVTIAKLAGDGNSSHYPSGSGVWSTPAGIVPTGVVSPYAGSSAPTGWLVCAGAAVSRTTYAGLFGVVSTTYGSGDGSTTFNVPDLTGRIPAGKEASATRLTATYFGGNSTTLGASGGSESSNFLYAHTHTGPSHTHDISHTHTMADDLIAYGGTLLAGGSTYGMTHSTGRATSAASSSTSGDGGTGETGSKGSGTAGNICQPTLILNYIIKY